MVTAIRYKPNPRECALLFLALVAEREGRRGKSLTRLRLSETTLKQLWNRERLTEGFLREVDEWLLTAGWVLISGSSTFGAVKEEAVGNWPRISSKRISDTLKRVAQGTFDFGQLEHLLATRGSADHAADDLSIEFDEKDN
ncbi:MAG TPA: hypothetical protein VK456_03750 [Xanthobacteraceae bacterium]|nr:hypothetical protein [Xanthobacteraceae bacterium]